MGEILTLPTGDISDALEVFLEHREVGPAFLQMARRVVQLTIADTELSVDTLATHLLHNEIALSGGTPAVLPASDNNTNSFLSLPYDFSLINASEDLDALTSTLHQGVHVKFCLYGPLGTGNRENSLD